jgi:hypothetical protein
MVGHQAPGHEADSAASGLFSHELQIAESILIVCEDVDGTDATLGNVVWVAWHNQARETGHKIPSGTAKCMT